MSKLSRVIPIAILTTTAAVIAGCSSLNGTGDRRLQSVSLSPASATGHDTSTGEVQFTATGAFNIPPSPVTPVTVSSWIVSDPAIATVTQTGVSNCQTGAMGTVTVKALASSGSDTAGSAATLVTGIARLMCP